MKYKCTNCMKILSSDCDIYFGYDLEFCSDKCRFVYIANIESSKNSHKISRIRSHNCCFSPINATPLYFASIFK